MDFKNCSRCGKIFNAITGSVCNECIKLEERSFEELKAYIRENSHCKMEELSKATNVPIKRILKYIKEGRLEISEGMSGDIVCESCGVPITRGRFCDACVIQINNTVSDMFSGSNASQSESAHQSGAKMHTTSRKKL